jgi:hypothetical protein
MAEEGWRPEDATLNTMVLTEPDGKTIWTLTTTYPSREVRDAAYALKQAWDGMNYSLDRLDAVLLRKLHLTPQGRRVVRQPSELSSAHEGTAVWRSGASRVRAVDRAAPQGRHRAALVA